MKLTTVINGKQLFFYHVEGTSFSFEGNFDFKAGKTGFTQKPTSWSPLSNPILEKGKITLKKSEIEKLGTYMVYADGVQINLQNMNWTDEQGRKISLIDYTDAHYYFKRADCGMIKITQPDGGEYYSVFHSKLTDDGVISKN